MSIILNDPLSNYGYGNAVPGNSLGGQLQAAVNQRAQPHYPDTGYILAQQILSVHKLSHGWIVKCGQKTYPCADEAQALLDTISLALVHHSMDTNK